MAPVARDDTLTNSALRVMALHLSPAKVTVPASPGLLEFDAGTLSALAALRCVSVGTRDAVDDALVSITLENKLQLIKDAAHCGREDVFHLMLYTLSSEERASAAFKAAVDFAFTSSIVMMHPRIAYVLADRCGANDVDNRGCRNGIRNCMVHVQRHAPCDVEHHNHILVLKRIITAIERSGVRRDVIRETLSKYPPLTWAIL